MSDQPSAIRAQLEAALSTRRPSTSGALMTTVDIYSFNISLDGGMLELSE